jgi:hypothetical protein
LSHTTRNQRSGDAAQILGILELPHDRRQVAGEIVGLSAARFL